MTNQELFDQLIQKIGSLQYIHTSQIPNINLYMDQLTTFMDTFLADTKRYPQDKVLTKTMINNYAKNNLLPSPINKKYSENHLLQLIYIYYMKNVFSISDIETILRPLTEQFWEEGSTPSFPEIYEKLFSYSDSGIRHIQEELTAKFEDARSVFICEDPQNQEYLQLFSFLCMITYDIYMKKQVVTGIIDYMKEQQEQQALMKKEQEKQKQKEKKVKK